MAQGEDGAPIAMIVGTFTAVSLNPPLVAFLPAHSSTTWPKLRERGTFCINVLARGHEALVRALSARRADALAGEKLVLAGNGAPRLPGAVASVECELSQVVPAGDHDIAICRVSALDAGDRTEPLIFLGGSLIGAGALAPG